MEKTKTTKKYNYLKIDIVDTVDIGIRKNFSRSQRQQVKLSALAATLIKCPICLGYMDTYSISVDHIIRKQDGGTNSKSNAQVTHLYCNTTFKN